MPQSTSPGAPSLALLAVDGVGVRLGDGDGLRWVLRDVSLSVRPGCAVVLLGPSGSGKSTLLNVIGGILKPDAGTIRLTLDAGRETLRLDALSERQRVAYRRRHVGFVFQFFNLVPTLTVAENVLLPLELNGRMDRAEAALNRLDALGIGGARNRFPERLSGGEQQRAAIARALAHGPSLVLADEPTGNLDAGNSARVAECLWQEARESGAALVLATHNESIAKRADSVVSLR